MPTKVVLSLLPFAIGLVLSACGDQNSFGPAAVDDASLTAPQSRVELQGKKGPVGGVGGVKKDR
jgi:hypothetical protein